MTARFTLNYVHSLLRDIPGVESAAVFQGSTPWDVRVLLRCDPEVSTHDAAAVIDRASDALEDVRPDGFTITVDAWCPPRNR